MFTHRTAWGVDIGEWSVKAVKIRRTKIGAEVLAFDTIERPLPSEESGDRDYHLRTAISELAGRNAFGRTPVVVSISEPAFSRFIPLPPVDKRRIPEVVRYEARQQIPFPIDEVVWDYQVVREPSEAGEETEVAIFSLRSQFVHALLANLSLCKVQPASILPVSLALYNYLTFDRDIAKGTIVVDLGAGSTDILICDPENFRVRNITVSGGGITRALAERLKISHEQAENLKRDSKDKVQAARLFKLIQPVLNDLVGQVQRTIGFFKSQIHNVRIEQAMLLGNTFKLPGTSEFLVNQLGCDLMSAAELERITLGSGVDGAALKEMLPSLSVAVGLALQGVGLGRVRVNLMPREELRRQEVARKRPYAAACVGCLAVMLGAHLLALKAEESQISANLTRQREGLEALTSVRSSKSEYSIAQNTVSVAEKKLETPTRLGVGDAQSPSYRGCIKATSAIGEILSEVSPEMVIREISVTPAQVKFTPEELGGKATGDKVMAAVKIQVAGLLTRPEALDLIARQLLDRIKSASVVSDGGTRPVFAHVEYGIVSVTGGIGVTVQCDMWVGD